MRSPASGDLRHRRDRPMVHTSFLLALNLAHFSPTSMRKALSRSGDGTNVQLLLKSKRSYSSGVAEYSVAKSPCRCRLFGVERVTCSPDTENRRYDCSTLAGGKPSPRIGADDHPSH